MNQSLRELKGVGEKTDQLFRKLGISTAEDLLQHFPRDYESYETPIKVSEVKEGTVCALRLFVASTVFTRQVRNLQITGITGGDETGKLPLVWFHAAYLRSTLKRGALYVFRGRVVRKNGALQMEQPEIFTPVAYAQIEGSLQPVYGLTAGLSNKMVTKLVRQVLKEQGISLEYLPEEVRSRYHLADEAFAVETMHFPRDKEELLLARRRIIFDEFFLFVLAVRLLKEKTEVAKNHFPMKPVWTTQEVIDALPFALTRAQQNVWGQIERDLCGRGLMSRLVQGDVGSGKTILAFLAMILAAENGYQSVLMAPTEILAKQHYEALLALLEENGLTKYQPLLLTGSLGARAKRKIYEQLADGSCPMVIGTHALIQEKVQYHRLGLVITDEQHRFGVRQREALTARGETPHVLVMSATPIPRTLAIILYGDLSVSLVDELPAQRMPIKNCVVNTSYRPTAYRFIEKQVRAGRQAYIICPMVGNESEREAENVTDYTETLRQVLPSDIRVEMLHGKMKAKEKNEIMEAFSQGEISVLVSTTVVEVGVNVPNATVMMVENAEFFGLAQLHQLRGRVGRGKEQSYCIFIQGNEEETTKKRLEILNKSSDGFFIAEEDLRLRGPGDFFGVRQSGDLVFEVADIFRDAEILKLAAEAAGEVMALDPDLTLRQNDGLRRRLDRYRSDNLTNISL